MLVENSAESIVEAAVTESSTGDGQQPDHVDGRKAEEAELHIAAQLLDSLPETHPHVVHNAGKMTLGECVSSLSLSTLRSSTLRLPPACMHALTNTNGGLSVNYCHRNGAKQI